MGSVVALSETYKYVAENFDRGLLRRLKRPRLELILSYIVPGSLLKKKILWAIIR